ncbi:Aspartate/glutamate/uridylate kinase [Penicillium maclennaniae]|uniref:Aspartate/glutamate/uridylate kinase n=1 Tax=Penicillium maclennaniae TaxID=1343394 RepID=UPI00254259E4|nr:Aspartate/glutamate/uridylate kinase [Penicillium maclennaniae]KAJ5674925.1 Aspartate/glutamate/uridylate kinase [Penicillium maclennaniae]
MLARLLRRPRPFGPQHGGRCSAASLSLHRSRTQINRAVITRLLRLIDSKQQIQHYLDEFHPSQGDSLAVIALGPNALSSPGSTTQAQLEQLADSLAFLRRVGLFPIVVHGELNLDLGFASNPRLERLANPLNRLQRIRTVNQQLSALFEGRDVETRPIPSGIFTAVAETDCTKSSHTGSVTDIVSQGIESAVRARSIPVVAALGTSSADSRTYVLDPHHAAVHLARVLQPLRSIFLYPNTQPSLLPPGPDASTALQTLARELGPEASIMLGPATALSNVIFPDPTLWTMLRHPRTVQTANCLQQFPSEEALCTALQRHLTHSPGIDIDAVLSQLESREFAAYFDHDPTSPSPEQTIHNLALVFPRASFPWRSPPTLLSGRQEGWASSSTTASVEESHLDGSIFELTLFSISQPDWRNGVAEKFWNRIRADHVSLWGSLAESDPSLSWWLNRSSGSLKRRPEERVYLWHGVVT